MSTATAVSTATMKTKKKEESWNKSPRSCGGRNEQESTVMWWKKRVHGHVVEETVEETKATRWKWNWLLWFVCAS
jgi:hypothetical protein